ncbi:UNVERIFIED_ORG: hypothetical protein J2W16_001749 [Pseudomonas cremoricolorata]|jgi:hypothetical protein|nr:hypothetical protein [Pseudomonas cremoricolorata]
MARACRTSAVDQTGRACSPPDHPARFKVENVARQVSWLAPAPGTVIRTGLGRRRLPAPGAVAVSTHRWCLQLRGQPRLEPRSRLSSGLAEEPRTAKATQWPSGGQPLSRLWGRRTAGRRRASSGSHRGTALSVAQYVCRSGRFNQKNKCKALTTPLSVCPTLRAAQPPLLFPRPHHEVFVQCAIDAAVC